MQVLELLRLRINALELPAAVEEFALELEGQRTDPGQITLFRTQARRDLAAADRALARLCAALGPEAVTRPQLRAAHLPEARLSWVPTAHVRFPEPRNMQVEGEYPPRIRRLLHRPKRLPPRPRREADGWIIESELGPVERMHGPYRASGGWWVREVERDYYFAETRSGAVLWVFYDRPRRRWFLHGWLE
jgi:protein ImuB